MFIYLENVYVEVMEKSSKNTLCWTKLCHYLYMHDKKETTISAFNLAYMIFNIAPQWLYT